MKLRLRWLVVCGITTLSGQQPAAVKALPASYAAPSVEALVQGSTFLETASSDAIALLTASLSGQPRDFRMECSAMRLATWQRLDGRWSSPVQDRLHPGSDITATALAIRAIHYGMPPELKAERDERILHGRLWLQNARPGSTGEMAMRILGLRWSHGPAQLVRQAVGQLLARQQADGSWGAFPERKGDAVSTAQAALALSVCNRRNSAWKKAIEWLRGARRPDGSWQMPHYLPGNARSVWAAIAIESASPQNGTRKSDGLAQSLRTALPPPWLRTALFGDLGALRKLLAKGLDVNSALPDGTTLLMAAARDEEKVIFLLDRGAQVNAAARSGWKALDVAATYGRSPIVLRRLLAAGAGPAPMKTLSLAANAVTGNPEALGEQLRASAKRPRP